MGRAAPITVDCETYPIQPRPDYPPKLVGVSIKVGRAPSRYMVFNHPHGDNNATKAETRQALLAAGYGKREQICHNFRFDAEDLRVHLDLPPPADVSLWHCTQVLAFLNDPFDRYGALKDLATEHLDWPPDEQEDVRDWLLANQPELKGKSKKFKGWGAYIGFAPTRLVSPYARGDTDRTFALWELWIRQIRANSNLATAYAREMRMLRTLTNQELRGMPVALTRLRRDVKLWERGVEVVDDWLRKRLRAPLLDVDKNAQLAEALSDRGAESEEGFMLTPKGEEMDSPGFQQVSLSKVGVELGISDKFEDVKDVLRYRMRLSHGLRNFGRPWIESARRNSGRVMTEWHSVRREGGGARTGRLSSSPNLQNITGAPPPCALMSKSKRATRSVRLLSASLAKNQSLLTLRFSAALFAELPALPELRTYVVPPQGQSILLRDYSQQELRILAHFEQGALLDKYLMVIGFDAHDYASIELEALLGVPIPRLPVKILAFSVLYGMGILRLAEQMGMQDDVSRVRQLKRAYLRVLPGVADLDTEIKAIGKADEILYTWGGRQLWREPSRIVDGRLRTFEYKLLNHLIQGSAADVTKEGINEADEAGLEVMGSFHDEGAVLCDTAVRDDAMREFKRALESPELDLPMPTTGKWSTKSWADCKKCDI